MKYILSILILLLTLSASAQEVEQIVPADIITGSNSGDAEIKEAFRRFNVTDTLLRLWINNSKAIFNWEDSTITILNYIDWKLDSLIEFPEGRTGWDEVNKTLSTGLRRGSVLQHGRELVVDAINKTGDTIFNGQTVRISGAQGRNSEIALGNNKYDTTAFTIIGLATQDIPNNQSGFVTFFGEVRDISTDGWPAESILWADSIDGGMTNVRPIAPNIAVVIGVVLRSHPTEGIIGIRAIPVFRLAWLSDVKAQGSQAHWDMLYWNEDSLRFELTNGLLNLPNLSTYADNAAALLGGLVAGDIYQTATGELMIVY